MKKLSEKLKQLPKPAKVIVTIIGAITSPIWFIPSVLYTITYDVIFN